MGSGRPRPGGPPGAILAKGDAGAAHGGASGPGKTVNCLVRPTLPGDRHPSFRPLRRYGNLNGPSLSGRNRRKKGRRDIARSIRGGPRRSVGNTRGHARLLGKAKKGGGRRCSNLPSAGPGSHALPRFCPPRFFPRGEPAARFTNPGAPQRVGFVQFAEAGGGPIFLAGSGGFIAHFRTNPHHFRLFGLALQTAVPNPGPTPPGNCLKAGRGAGIAIG